MVGLHHITRRRLLTAMALSPLLWQMNSAHAAAVDPKRIVALEWLPVELLLALGITPMASPMFLTTGCGSINPVAGLGD